MKIDTVRFGEVEVVEERIFDFKLPIIGFGELRKFVIVDTSEDSFFKWLQSTEDPSLAFPIISVFSKEALLYQIGIFLRFEERNTFYSINKKVNAMDC